MTKVTTKRGKGNAVKSHRKPIQAAGIGELSMSEGNIILELRRMDRLDRATIYQAIRKMNDSAGLPPAEPMNATGIGTDDAGRRAERYAQGTSAWGGDDCMVRKASALTLINFNAWSDGVPVETLEMFARTIDSINAYAD